MSRFLHREAARPARLAIAALVVAVALLVARVVAGGWGARLSLGALALALTALALAGVSNWRHGLLLFFGWLLFEDLPRKYLGNNMVVFFGKDVLIALTYAACAVAWHRERLRLPRVSFVLPLLIFVGWGAVQIFNPWSPSLWYGVAGFKLYFYYVPLMLVGFAAFRTPADLSRALVAFAIVSAVIAALGIAQGIIGLDFLNPAQLAPELEALGREIRTAPISGLRVPRATSIFVSEGRQGSFMLLAFVLNAGASVFLALRGDRWRAVSAVAASVAFAALLLHGSRAGFLYALVSLAVLGLAFTAFGRHDPVAKRRVARQLAVAGALIAVILVAMLLLFPWSVAARWSLYAETLSPWSPASELTLRLWQYPMLNLRGGLESGHLLVGQGIGTASLGVFYVQQLFGTPLPPPPVESGFGTLALEFGLLGPLLWLAWSAALLISGVRQVRALRGRSTFPLGVAMLWFIFVLLVPLTYGALNAYQNYLYNAFLWIQVGVLHRLPLLDDHQAPAHG